MATWSSTMTNDKQHDCNMANNMVVHHGWQTTWSSTMDGKQHGRPPWQTT